MTAAEFALFIGLAQATDQGQADAFIDKLIDLGISRYWFSNQSLAAMFQTAIQARRGNNPISLIGLLTTSDLNEQQQVLWAKKWDDCRGHDPVHHLSQLVAQVRSDAALREVQEIIGMAEDMARKNPRDVLVWLPTIIQALRATQSTGHQYNPQPSAIWATGYVPKVVAKFHRMGVFNEMLGGGLWDGRLAVYGTPTSQGKSTFAYTMVAHAVASGHKTVLFSREASAAEATARIVQAYGGFTRWEVEHKRGHDQESHAGLTQAIRELDRFLAIYDRHSAALGDFREIIHWEHPLLVIIDHLGLYGIDQGSKGLVVMGKRDPLGEIADTLRDITRVEKCTIFATSQFSSEEQRKLYRDRDLDPPCFYGSMRIAAASDYAYISMRDLKVKLRQWIRCKKDSAEGILANRDFYLGYNPETRSYYEIVGQTANRK